MPEIAMSAVAMGAKGLAMMGVFLLIVVALCGVGLISYMQAKRRNAAAGSQDDDRAGRPE